MSCKASYLLNKALASEGKLERQIDALSSQLVEANAAREQAESSLKEAVAIMEELTKVIDRYTGMKSMDMSGYHGMNIHIPKGDRGKPWHKSVWRMQQFLDSFAATDNQGSQ